MVRPEGNGTGRVGDLGLGLTNPIPLDGKVGRGAGLGLVDIVLFDDLEAAVLGSALAGTLEAVDLSVTESAL